MNSSMPGERRTMVHSTVSTSTIPTGVSPAPVRPRGVREVIYRHTLVVRITHWINVLAISLLLMSGLQIFNAHPHLYWGQYGADADKPWLEAVARSPDADPLRGVLRVGGLTLSTTGVLGVSAGQDGELTDRGFPKWATLPSGQARRPASGKATRYLNTFAPSPALALRTCGRRVPGPTVGGRSSSAANLIPATKMTRHSIRQSATEWA